MMNAARELAFSSVVGGVLLIATGAVTRAIVFRLIDRFNARLPLLGSLGLFAMGAGFLLAGLVGFFAEQS